ncbi:MAG: DUF2244 domain-containing protein [Alphaproteobacteria bacterium]
MASGNLSLTTDPRSPRPSGKPDFSALLTPHRSLGPHGFVILMVMIGAPSFVAGLLFYRFGAWPIVGFFGLDFLLIWLAFHLNFRSARAYEEIDIQVSALTIRKVAANGRAHVDIFNPAWVRLDIARDNEDSVAAIHVFFRDKAVQIGAFLNPQDRTEFAAAFADALMSARNGRS